MTAIPRFLLAVPHDADLVWFINHAESAQGMRSSHPALVAMIETGGQTRGSRTQPVTFSKGDDRDVEIDMSSADRRFMSPNVRRNIDKASRLRARWQRLTTLEQSTLVEAYAARPLPRETMAPLGQLAGVALLTEQVDGRGEWLLAMCRKPGQHAEALDEIRRDAATLVRLALAAWGAT
jgi:hypothetical protein